MKKISLHSFRTIYANLVILLIVSCVFSIAYFGNNINVFNNISVLPVYNGDRNGNNVSLMINVYWGTEYITPILDILDANNVKCTFFVGGCWVAQFNDVLEDIYNKGHEIGNHGYYHKDHAVITLERNREEIKITHELVKHNLGYEMNLFAPPSGSFNSNTLKATYELNYTTVMWTEGKDTIDWRDKNTALILSRATKNIRAGDLILMHPTKNTVEALDDIIITIKNVGLNLTTVSQCLQLI